MIRTVLASLVALAAIFFLGTPLLIYAVISGDTDPLYWAGRAGARATLWAAGIRIDVRGREKIAAGRAVVYMPNHQSNIDPPAVFVLLPPVLVLGKQEFFRTPVLGRAMRLRGFVPVDRKNRERAIEAVEQAVKSLKAGNSFLVYPEGTRSPDGRLQRFKKGAFMMALKAGVPIVPVSISGAFKIMRKGRFAIHPGRVRIAFHDPVTTEGCTLDDRERIMAAVRQAILSGLEPEERPPEEVEGGK
jgi:1-acyl-sn-glycerol-3-phosphate acyltransferase